MTIITFPLSEAASAHPHLRRFNARTDLRRVADLVELCFADTLDLDGRRYIQQMRRTAEHSQFLNWAASVASRTSFPFSGFVWEQDGEIIGNLSLIPMNARRRKVFLIANVAVHPDHRRRGIARKLTDAALHDCRARRADDVWLHVREDNPGAQALYQGMGFIDRGRRSSWHSPYAPREGEGSTAYKVVPAQARHRKPLLSWMRRLHPEHLDWYLSLKLNLFQPGPLGAVLRLLNGATIQQWAVLRGSRLAGAVSWQRTQAMLDRLWLAVPETIEQGAVTALLNEALHHLRKRKRLHLEIPVGLATDELEAAGFTHNHTLIWMQYGGLNDRNRQSR